MSQEKKSTVGDPIWVESIMTADEHSISHKKFPSTVTDSKPTQYNPNIHKGGKWRAGMGKGYSASEINALNDTMKKYYELLKELHEETVQ